jgi:hypothetical protein
MLQLFRKGSAESGYVIDESCGDRIALPYLIGLLLTL